MGSSRKINTQMKKHTKRKQGHELLCKINKSKKIIMYDEIPNEFKISHKVVLALIKKNYIVSDYNIDVYYHKVNIPVSLLDDHHFIIKLMNISLQIAFDVASERLKNDENTMIKFIEKKPEMLQFMTSKIQNTYMIVLCAVTKVGNTIQYASKELRNNFDVVHCALCSHAPHNVFKHVSKELKNNINIVKLAVSHDGTNLRYASRKLQNNYDIVMIAVSNNFAVVIDGMSNDLKQTVNGYSNILVKLAVDSLHNGYIDALKYASNKLQDNYDIVIAAVANNCNLNFVSERLRDNFDIVKMVMSKSNCGTQIQYVSDRLRNNYEIIMTGIKHDIIVYYNNIYNDDGTRRKCMDAGIAV
jgi:hypothetical protein